MATGTPLERDPDVLDTWFRYGNGICTVKKKIGYSTLARNIVFVWSLV